LDIRKLKDRVAWLLRDDKKLNRLLGKEEFSESDIIMAAELTLDDVNESMPVQQLTLSELPTMVALYGAVYFLLTNAIAGKTRDAITVNTGEVAYRREENLQAYMQLAEMYGQKYHTYRDIYKNQINIASSFSV